MQLVSANDKLKVHLTALEQESFEIQARLRRGLEVERENENMTRTAEQWRERERELVRESEELRGLVRMKEQEIERMAGKNDTVGYYQRQVEQELGQAKGEIARLTEVMNQMKTEEVKNEQRKNQYELEILDLKRQAQINREQQARTQAEIAQARKELEDEVNKSRSYLQQIDRLRALVESLDQTKEELVKRLQSTAHEHHNETQSNAVLLSDVQTYKRELQLRE